MNNKEIQEQIEALLTEVNRPLKVDSPFFSQKAYDMSELMSKCGKLWARAKANYEGQKLDFEIWESLTELDIRNYHENQSSAKQIIKEKTSRITEGQIKAEIKTDPKYKEKRMMLLEAEELFNMAEKAVYEACKMRGFVTTAIVRKRED